MKRGLLLIFFFYSIFWANGQGFIGFEKSPYGGIYSVSLQPASLGTLPFDFDGNLLAISASVVLNELVPQASSSNMLLEGESFGISAILTTQSNEFFTSGNIQLPSLAYRIDDRSGVSLSWRVRAIGYARATNTNLAVLIETDRGFSAMANLPILESAFGVANSWQEISASYGRNVWQNGRHRFSAGASIKYIIGGASGSTEIKGLNIDYDPDTETFTDISGEVTFTYNSSLEDLYEGKKSGIFTSSGWGLDLGFNYDLLHGSGEAKGRPYWIRFSSSLRDIGSVNYSATNNSATYSLSLSQPIDAHSFDNLTGIQDLSQRLQNTFDFERIAHPNYSFRLPTNLNLFVDWNLWDHIYLNLGYQSTAVDLTKNYGESVKWRVYQMAARYDRPKYGFSAQVDYNKIVGWSVSLVGRYSVIGLGLSNFLKTKNDDAISALGAIVVLRVPLLPKSEDRRSRIF
ncbi:MAG: DUF5723 family protein [Bacteroidota bacterium]|nr:DUF5723 family protein [Bacteroidota bacterium]MDX5404179.1 DUF5723 family protein [Bacteroidota bacterium]MDX5505657.1 DUF5723 family protein [Bacteroidota bacterium]